MNRRTLLLICLSGILAGCTTFNQKKQETQLDPALSAYTGAIRWGNIETAAGFARPRETEATKANPNALAGLKITGYKVRVNKINETADEADVSISFTYYHEDKVSLREVIQNATWYYKKPENVWLMDDNLPEFKY